MIACCDAVREQEMVYVDGQGNIVRPRRGIPRIWTLCAVVGVANIVDCAALDMHSDKVLPRRLQSEVEENKKALCS